MRKFLIVLVLLLVAGLVAADRIGVRTAQNEIARQVGTQYDLQRHPDVKIHGFPFLTQAIGGEYDRIDVRIGDWTERGVTVGDVTIEMRGVRAPLRDVASGKADNIVASTATASAVLPYDVIRKQGPKEITSIEPDGDGLKVGMSGTILGFPVDGDARLKVEPTPEGIKISPTSVGAAGVQIPVAMLSWTVPVTDLPLGSRVSRIEPTADGLRVAATAENVRLSEVANQAPTQ